MSEYYIDYSGSWGNAPVVNFNFRATAYRPDEYSTKVTLKDLSCKLTTSGTYATSQDLWIHVDVQGIFKFNGSVNTGSSKWSEKWMNMSGEFGDQANSNDGSISIKLLFWTNPHGDHPDTNYWISNVNVGPYCTRATNTSAGKIHSTNNSGGSQNGVIQDVKTNEVWFSWTDAKSGTTYGVDNNSTNNRKRVKMYAVDCLKNSNNVDNAGSKQGLTYPYTKNTHLKISDVMSQYSLAVNDELHCWVNTCLQDDSWLGRQPLGTIKIITGGRVMYKDSSGTWHQCGLRIKDTGGTVRTLTKLQVKDTGGTVHQVDI